MRDPDHEELVDTLILVGAILVALAAIVTVLYLAA